MTPAELRAWRKSLGLTQAQAGDALGLSPSTVFRMEKGDTVITRQTEILCSYVSNYEHYERFRQAAKAYFQSERAEAK